MKYKNEIYKSNIFSIGIMILKLVYLLNENNLYKYK